MSICFWREPTTPPVRCARAAVSIVLTGLLLAGLAFLAGAAPAERVIADGGWHAIPGSGRTRSQPIGVFIPPGKEIQHANSVGVVILGAEGEAYYQNYSLASESWAGNWGPLSIQTPTPPRTFVGGSWDILVRDPKSGNKLHVENGANGWSEWRDEGADDGQPWGTPTETEDGRGRLWSFRRGPKDRVEYRCLPRDVRPPVLEPQVGHLGWAQCVAFSPDGRTLASGGADGKIILWDVATGGEQRVLTGHSGEIRSLAWSPDGTTLVSGSQQDWTIRFWDARTGEPLRTLYSPAGVIAFSPNGKSLASGDRDIVKLWDVQTGAELRPLPGHLGEVRSLAFSPDGQRLVVGSREWKPSWESRSGSGELKLWDVSTGAVRWSKTLSGPTYGVAAVAFSPGGQTIASGGGADHRSGDLRLWDARTGTLERTVPGHIGVVWSLLFAPDGHTLVSGSDDWTVRVWDAPTGASLKTFRYNVDAPGAPFGVALSPDGHTVATACENGEVRLWDVPTGEQRRKLGWADRVNDIAISPDGNKIVSGASDNAPLRVWDARTGALAWIPIGHKSGVWSVAFSHDGKMLASAARDGSVKLWDVKGRAELRAFSENRRLKLNWVALSPDGKLLARAVPGKEIPILDTTTGALVHTLRIQDGPDKDRQPGADRCQVAFSPNGKLVATGYGGDAVHEPAEIRLWDARTWQRLRTLKADMGLVMGLTFSPDSKTLAAGNPDATRLWDVATGQLRRTLQPGNYGALAFSPDGTLLASPLWSEIRLWQVASGAQLQTLRGHTDNVQRVSFSPDGLRLVSGGVDHTVKVWEAGTGRLLATLLTVPPRQPGQASSEWLAVTPDGYYDGSPGADRLIQWRIGSDLFPLEAYERTFHRPDLLRRSLAGEILAETPPLRRFTSGRMIPPQVTITQPRDGQTVSGSIVRVQVTVTDARGDVRVEVHVNGRPVSVKPITVGAKPIRVGAKPIQIGAKSLALTGRPILAGAKPITVGGKPIPAAHRFEHHLTCEVPLPPGETQVTLKAIATDADAVQGWAELHLRRPLAVATGTPVAAVGDLYVLAIGVSHYQNPSYNLKYAAADATAFAGLWQRMAGTLYRRVLVTSLLDTQATTANVRAALRRLETITNKDSVALFLSGHGVYLGDREFYFATHDIDASRPERVPETALPWMVFEKTLAKVDAKRVFLFLDACHSGSALGDRLAGNERLAEALARHGNVLVFASSRAGEVSWESAALHHGAFTAALLEGIGEGKADWAIGGKGDGKITAEELLAYLRNRVPQLTEDRQTPTVPLLYDFGEQFLLARTR